MVKSELSKWPFRFSNSSFRLNFVPFPMWHALLSRHVSSSITTLSAGGRVEQYVWPATVWWTRRPASFNSKYSWSSTYTHRQISPLSVLKNHWAYQHHHSHAFPPQIPLQEDSKPSILRSQARTIKSASHYLSKSKQQSTSNMPCFSGCAGDETTWHAT